MGERFYVVLGDVVSSRKIEDRGNLQKSIEGACRRVNSNYSRDIYADFKLLKGNLTNLVGQYRISLIYLEFWYYLKTAFFQNKLGSQLCMIM